MRLRTELTENGMEGAKRNKFGYTVHNNNTKTKTCDAAKVF